MTLTASTNFLMSHVHRRWMTHLEQLTVQGFPISTEYTHGHPCSSFALRFAKLRWGEAPDTWPSRNAMRHMAGNSMHVACSGVIFMFVLTQAIIDSNMVSLQKFNIQRSLKLSTRDDHKRAHPDTGNRATNGPKRLRLA